MADSDNDSGGAQNNSGGGGGNVHGELSAREQDRLLPIANVSRIMKKALPANAKISKDAKETVQECVSEFISFVTGEASDKCQREKRKTINGDDLLWAMMTLGFEEYVEPLKVYLQKFREVEGERTAVCRQSERDGGGGSVGDGGNGGVVNTGSFGSGYGGMQQQPIMMMGHHQHHPQGHVYGSGSSYHQTGGGGRPATGGSSSGGGGATGRPR